MFNNKVKEAEISKIDNHHSKSRPQSVPECTRMRNLECQKGTQAKEYLRYDEVDSDVENYRNTRGVPDRNLPEYGFRTNEKYCWSNANRTKGTISCKTGFNPSARKNDNK